MFNPRQYQLKCVDDCRDAFRRGARAVLLVVPTGGGKTVVGSLVVKGALERGNRILWVAHRRELIDQAASRMPVPAGVIMAGRKPDPTASIQVASIDTIVDRSDQGPPADLIVYDEAHHIVANTSRALLSRYPQAKVLGLTATPSRGDGAALGDVFEEMVHGPSVRCLIGEGHLVESDVIGPADEASTLAADPVDAWLRYADGRPGFIFCRTIKQSKEVVAALCGRGVPAAHVDGSTAKRTRDRAIEQFRACEIDILSSVGVFTEGVDLPRAAVCLLARGCEHAGLYLQMVGRVLRPYPGKQRAIVVDLIGVAHRHGLPDDDREWSLDGVPIRLVERLESITQCPDCGAVWRPSKGRMCPRCAWAMPDPEAPAIAPRPLADLRERLRDQVSRPLATPDQKAKELARLRMIAREKGYKQSWVGVRFRALFGHWPKGIAI